VDANNQVVTVEHGGYRAGAGRKSGSRDKGSRLSGKELGLRIERLQRTGAIKTTSAKVMHAVGDAEYWLHLISELERAQEWVTLVDVLKFHQQMDEGRPAQRINITSQNITVSVREVEAARAVVRELMTPKLLTPATTEHNVIEGQGVKKGG
jgi:hypothetical protein